MSLANSLGSGFSSTTRNRGRAYFLSGRVRISQSSDDHLTATVSGSRRTPYSVEIDWSDIMDGQIIATCTCPHYEDGFLCKHIWATLLAMEDGSWSDEMPTGEASVLHEYDEELEYADDDRYDDEFDDIEQDEFAPYPASPMWGSVQKPRTPHRPSSPNWQTQLRQVSDYAALVAQHSGGPSDTPKLRQAWFALNIEESARRGHLVIDLREQESRKDGELGSVKKLSVRRDSIPPFTDPEDTRLIELLLGNQSSDDSSYGSYSYYSYQPFSRVVVAPAMYEFLLPRLSATERLVYLPDGTVSAEASQSVTWDDAGCWQFHLKVEEDNPKRLWRISGQITRGNEAVPLGDPVLLMATGLVLFPDRLARLDVSTDQFGWIVTMRRQGLIEVPYSERGRLLETLYRLPMPPDIEWPVALRVHEHRERPCGRIEIQSPDTRAYDLRAQLCANIGFLYGEQKFDLEDHSSGRFDDGTDSVWIRDRQAEAELLSQLSRLRLRPPKPSSIYGRNFDLSFPETRLPEVVRELTGKGWTVESKGVRVRQPGTFNLSVTSGVDWFQLDGQVDFDGVTASLPSLLKALRNREAFIRLDDGSQGLLPEVWLEKYGHLADMARSDGDALRFGPSQALLLDALLAEQENVHVDRQFAAFRKKLEQFDGVKPAAEPRGFHGNLRKYQKEGLGWLNFLREFRLGGCLADDMGLGKTIQVLALLQSRRLRRLKEGEQRSPSIVVVPKSLVFNWIDEAARFTPNLRTFDYTGTGRKSRLEDSDGFDLLVTTYGTLRRDIASLKEMAFDYAILDESQAVKNQNSQAAKACRLLRADHRLAMTGTPIENHLGELWSLFEFLNPGMLGRSAAFNALTKNGNGDNGSLVLLSRALRPFLLRRTKEQVLAELPKKTEQTLYCELTGKNRKAYNDLRDYYRAELSGKVKELGLKRAKIHVLEALLRLRQAACHPGLLDQKQAGATGPKLEALLEQLREVLAEGHKALVFSQFTSLLAIVRHHLDQAEIAYEYLDGRTRKRAERVKRFQNDSLCPVFLISLKAGGHGLNLTAADYVFILDPWWNPAVESQAIDRAHRIGQNRPVFAYRLICRDTVEEKILELQKTKRDLADAIVSADNSLIRSLTAEDLQLLLS